jgi:hypothetical protein
MRYQGKEETMPTWGWIVISLALLAALEVFGWMAMRRRRTQELRSRSGHSRPRLG